MSKQLILSASLSILMMAGFALSNSVGQFGVAATAISAVDLSVPGPKAFFAG